MDFVDKIALIEEAEREGYIIKCSKCGSYKVDVEKGTFITWGDKEESYTDYRCDTCGHSW